MVIHTKEKAKIHAHEPKGAKIKGSNIYTVERGPKTIGAKVSDDKKKSYRKSTIHQSEPKNKGLSRFKRNLKESNISIKTKNTNLHIAGRTGALAAGAVTEQVEGGQEVSQAAYLAYEASRPVTGTASKGAALFRKKAAAGAKKRIKKVEAGKKLAKRTAKKAAKDTAKTVAKETAKETAKTTAKVATKTATKAAATAAGTAVAPGVGTAIGMAAGYAAGVSIEVKDEKMTNRSRKIKYFFDKMKAQENQTDSVGKLVKDLIMRKAVTWVKAAAPIVGLVLLLLVLLVAIIAVPVILVIAVLYNSPFALFMPPLEAGDTVQSVTSAYVQEFNEEVKEKADEHADCDIGEIVYVDYEGMDENPSNYYDIMAVYMVKHGVGDTATVMNDTSKGWLKDVVDDMCSYSTSTGIKEVQETDESGNVTTVTKTVLSVNVTLKYYRDMISIYSFDSNQTELIGQMMSSEFMGQPGIGGNTDGNVAGGDTGGGTGQTVSSMTEEEINVVLTGIIDNRQRSVCSYALHRVGYPYSQEKRNSGSYYDCSSLAYYSWKDAGADISYGGATTAAAEAQGLDQAGKTVSFDQLQPGDLIFYSFAGNGRYKNISHVAVYVGNGRVVEALNERLGVVYRDVKSTGKIVMIGRP
ncbi:C40 family peptidase [Agathobacter rectalis]|uniref:C40 family peptidase n=1 Tax=Agathobacter rectalis TaxID=39491 RepID=A0AAX0BG07_9FIRM|nr:NlpC/P60 family protein [Agathobacter rectalis]NSC26698.1 C40 family peptidase [Agathobacter rectalis]NSC36733.1 C40 family peptidase [Agathobacter rectalis]NSC52447.1 C40 family peptidase [Agathobacter rectalis]NSC58322.1 C40 family peptidase [Agathobacter rectalis]NSC64038.1 C40 family peptidase [Agathobacter rectalis]